MYKENLSYFFYVKDCANKNYKGMYIRYAICEISACMVNETFYSKLPARPSVQPACRFMHII